MVALGRSFSRSVCKLDDPVFGHDRNCLDLDQPFGIDKLRDLNQGASGIGIAEILGAGRVDFLDFGNIGHENGDLHDIVHRAVDASQDSAEIF